MNGWRFAFALAAGLTVAVPHNAFAQQPDLNVAAEAQPQPAPAAEPQPTPAAEPEPTASAVQPAARVELPDWPPAGVAAPAPDPAPAPDLFKRFRENIDHPLTVGGKFKRSIKEILFPGIPASALAAGFGMATDKRVDRDYGMGFDGFVRRWGSAFGENAVGSFVGDFALASMMHQDPRYHPDKHKNFFHRLGHAVGAVFVTQSDSGKTQFNASHLLGITAGAGASTGWHHSSDQGADLFGQRVGYDALSSAIYNCIAEFIFWRNYDRH